MSINWSWGDCSAVKNTSPAEDLSSRQEAHSCSTGVGALFWTLGGTALTRSYTHIDTNRIFLNQKELKYLFIEQPGIGFEIKDLT